MAAELLSWLETGRFVYPVLGFIAAELVFLLVWRRRTGRGLAPVDIVGNLAAGGLIFLALERALSGAHWGWVVGFSAASLPAHLFDLVRRWRSESAGPLKNP